MNEELSAAERFDQGRWILEPLSECPLFDQLQPLDLIEAIIIHERRDRLSEVSRVDYHRIGSKIILECNKSKVVIYATPYTLDGCVTVSAEYPTCKVKTLRGKSYRQHKMGNFCVWLAFGYLFTR